MTVSSQTNNATFLGNGVTTVFPLPFRFFSNGDVFAYFIDSTTGASTPMSLGVDYTLTGAGEPEVNGNAVSVLTTTAPLANGRGLYVERMMQPVQNTDIVNQGEFFASTHEDVFDRLTMLIQQANANSQGAIRVAIGDPEPSRLVPAEQRANLLMGFDSHGNPIAVAPVAGSASALALALASSSGATMVGRGAGTVDSSLTTIEAMNADQNLELDDLDIRVVALEIGAVVMPAIIANNGSATARNITLIGDSISHGAFAINSFMHSWARIFNRMINAETGGSSYGFTNWQTLGSGATETLEIHDVSFGGPAWGGVSASSAQAAASPTGAALRAGGVGSTMTLGLPFFQNLAEMHYIQQPGGGTFTIKVNGGLVATVNTSGVLGRGVSAFNLADAGSGYVTVTVEQTASGIVDIVGPSYFSPTIEPVFNNWSETGRRLRYMGEAIISSLMAESSTLVMALGHNDQGDADADNAYYGEFVQRITWLIQYAKQYNVKVVVPDFCWTAAESSRARAELRRLAAETGGLYINLPKMIFSGGIAVSTTHLINTLKMWTDGSHPNKEGHKWIAETVARAMGLSCATKRDAIRHHDFWMPLPLASSGGATNYEVTAASSTSAYRRTGDLISVKVFVKKGENAFPVGSTVLSASFNPKSELNAAQGLFSTAYVRTDTGTIISVFSCGQGGAITLNVLSPYTTEQMFSFSLPIFAGYV